MAEPVDHNFLVVVLFVGLELGLAHTMLDLHAATVKDSACAPVNCVADCPSSCELNLQPVDELLIIGKALRAHRAEVHHDTLTEIEKSV